MTWKDVACLCVKNVLTLCVKEMHVQGVQKVTTQNRVPRKKKKKLEVLEKTYCRSQLVL